MNEKLQPDEYEYAHTHQSLRPSAFSDTHSLKDENRSKTPTKRNLIAKSPIRPIKPAAGKKVYEMVAKDTKS